MVFVSKLLAHRYPLFFFNLLNCLRSKGINLRVLTGTRDIWVRDFMPLQIDQNKFVQFSYRPKYLLLNRKYRRTITDPNIVCRQLGINAIGASIVLDGGNIIRENEIAICTDRIFIDNPLSDRKNLFREMCSLLELERFIVLPQDPFDPFGHIDGMVRFYNKKTVLINDYSKEDSYFSDILRRTLSKAGLESVPIPYNSFRNVKLLSAKGNYINFLRVKDAIITPVFGTSYDDYAIKAFEKLFGLDLIVPINSRAIADDGGVINCVTWNIEGNAIFEETRG